MGYLLRASDLGLRNDHLDFSGVTAADVVAQVVAYLDVEYGIKLPEAHIIFREKGAARWVLATGETGRQEETAATADALPATAYAAVLERLRSGVPISIT